MEKVPDAFCGVLALCDGEECDCCFSVVGNKVTVVPLSEKAREQIHILSYNTGGANRSPHWLYGLSDFNSVVALLKTTPMGNGFSSGINLFAGYFCAPVIVHGSRGDIEDVRTFDAIEFYGGIMDVLHNPVWAIDFFAPHSPLNASQPDAKHFNVNVDGEAFKVAVETSVGPRALLYVPRDAYTRQFDVVMDETSFKVEWSIRAPFAITSSVPDLKNEIHSYLRFKFASPQPLDTLQKYYGYARNLFQFCSGRLNVRTDIRLYQTGNSDPIYVKIKDGYSDYADETLNFMQVIRLSSLEKNFSELFCLLNDKGRAPYLEFLPFANKNVGVISYTNVNDLCIAFEREYGKWGEKADEQTRRAAKALAKKLQDEIKKDSAPEFVKEKARSLLSQLNGFSPSLKEKILYLYERYGDDIKRITEQEGHDKLAIAKFYTKGEFQKKIADFVKVRNSAAHYGIRWNGGEEIFYHLELLIYCSALERAGFSVHEASSISSWLLGHYF